MAAEIRAGITGSKGAHLTARPDTIVCREQHRCTAGQRRPHQSTGPHSRRCHARGSCRLVPNFSWFSPHLRPRRVHAHRLLLGCVRRHSVDGSTFGPPTGDAGTSLTMARQVCLCFRYGSGGSSTNPSILHPLRPAGAVTLPPFGIMNLPQPSFYSAIPVAVDAPANATDAAEIASAGWASISAGYDTTCGIARYSRNAYCWVGAVWVAVADARAHVHTVGGGDQG